MKKKKLSFIIEIVLFFLITFFVNKLIFAEDMGFLKSSLHPYWIAVIFIPLRYGFFAGFITSVVACVNLFYFQFGYFPNRAEFEQLLESNQLNVMLGFLVLGVLIGAVRQRYIIESNKKDRKIEEIDKRFKVLEKNFEAADKARKLLEERIVGESKTVKTLYNASRKFDSLTIESVYQGCLDILNDALSVTKSSLYVLEGEDLVLKASFGWEHAQEVEAKQKLDESIMSLVFKNPRTLTVKEILHSKEATNFSQQFGKFLAMIPILDKNDKVYGVVNVEQLDFVMFNKANLELIEVIVDWASKVIETKKYYESIEDRIVFSEDKSIYSFNYLKHMLGQEFLRARTCNLELSLSIIKINQIGFYSDDVQRLILQTVQSYLRQQLTELDFIFHYKFLGTFVVISPNRKEQDLKDLFDQSNSNMEIALENKKINCPIIKYSVLTLSEKIENFQDFLKEALTRCDIKNF